MKNQLYNRRKELGLTLEQVGILCEVGKSTVRKWETGEINNMGRDKIIKLSKALKVSPQFVLQADCNERVLSTYDMRLLAYIDKLTDIGKNKILNYANDLITNPIYQKDNTIVNAAHERTDIETTNEGKEHDNNIMMNDSEWE